MILNATLFNNEIKIDNNYYHDENGNRIKPLVRRNFTQEELDLYKQGFIKLNATGDDVELDQAKYDDHISKKLNSVYNEKIDKVSSKTEDIIINSGFTHNNTVFSTSKSAQMNLGNLVNMDNIGAIDWVNPYPYSTGDHNGDYMIQNQAELHLMAKEMALVIVPALRAGSALEKQLTDILKSTQGQNPTRTKEQAIIDLEVFQDSR